jgi:hypothetical protein
LRKILRSTFYLNQLITSGTIDDVYGVILAHDNSNDMKVLVNTLEKSLPLENYYFHIDYGII